MSVTHSQPQSNEAELIKSVCGGEREAFYELVHPYERMIYATAISVVKNPADAEEVAQDAVLKAFSNLASFRAEAKFSTWILQITYNEAKMRLKKARSHLYESIDDSGPSEYADYWPKDFADWRPIPSELFDGCRFFGAQILDVPQKKDFPIDATERIGCVLYGLTHLAPFEQFGRYRSPIGKVFRPIVRILAWS